MAGKINENDMENEIKEEMKVENQDHMQKKSPDQHISEGKVGNSAIIEEIAIGDDHKKWETIIINSVDDEDLKRNSISKLEIMVKDD